MKIRVIKSKVILMANCNNLKLSGIEEKDVLLTKRQYANTTDASSTTSILNFAYGYEDEIFKKFEDGR